MFSSIDEINKKYSLHISPNSLIVNEIISIFNTLNIDELKPELYDLNNSEILNTIGLYYRIHSSIPLMMKYFLMAIELGNSDSMNNLGYYYKQIGDIPSMMKYYLMAIELSNSSSMNNLGYYYKQLGDIPSMMKYFLMAIELCNVSAMNNLGNYYKQISDFPSMMKYFLMAIEFGNSNSMNNLGYYYEQISDHTNAIKYYLMAIELANSCSMDNLETYINNNLYFYRLLKTIQSNNLIENKIKTLESDKQIIHYENKKKIFEKFNNYKNCIICSENLINIDLNCGHEICECCYCDKNILICPICLNPIAK